MQNMDSLISVIIPVYNVELYIKRCIESVISQTYKNLEIILIDDGSTDKSGKICDWYLKKDNRIKVVHQKNQGLSVARNTGLNMATGDWIAFLDSDDWIAIDMYEKLLFLAKSNDADISSCNTINVDENGSELEKKDYSDDIKIFNQKEMIAGLLDQKYVRFEVWNKLWRKTLISNVRFVAGQVCEDVHFDRILFLKANKMVYIDHPYHFYLYKRPGNTNSSFKVQRFSIFDEFDSLIEDLNERQDIKSSEIVRCIAVRFSLLFYEEAIVSKQSLSIKKQLLDYFKKYYKLSIFKKYNTLSATLKMILFNINPILLIGIRKVQGRY